MNFNVIEQVCQPFCFKVVVLDLGYLAFKQAHHLGGQK